MAEPFEKIAEEATRQIDQRNYDSAIQILKKAWADWQHEAEYWTLLGQAYLSGGRVPEAEEAYARSHTISPGFGSQFNLAECAFVRGDHLLATGGFRKALGLMPEDPSYRSIAAFKVIVSEALCGEAEQAAGELEPELTPAGRLYLEIFKRLIASESASALALLKLPEAMDGECAPYLDTLLTAELISIQPPATAP